MLIYGTKLVVLPFRKDTLTDEQEGGVGEGYACSFLHMMLIIVFFNRNCVSKTKLLTVHLINRPKSSFLPSYIIDVRELDEKLLNIIDMKFLHGYYEPTLLILFEPNQTWPGWVPSVISFTVTTTFLIQLVSNTFTLCCLSRCQACCCAPGHV